MKKKHVLIIGNWCLPLPAIEGGAVETLVDEFLKYNIKNKNIMITVYSPKSNKISNELNKKYTNCEFRYVDTSSIKYKMQKILLSLKRRLLKNKCYPISYCISVINDLKKKNEIDKYDITIVENQVSSLPTYKKNINSKLVNHLHNDYLNIKTKFSKQIVASCDEFWCVSKFISDQIKQISEKANTKVLYNGVDIKKFKEKISNKEKNTIYKKIGFNKNDFIIIYTGRIIQEKGILQLLKVFNQIKSEGNSNLKLLILGGKINDKKHRDFNKKIHNEYMKNNESICMYGYASVEELRIMHSISSLQVIPTTCEEAFGLILIEGMCFNHLIINTNSGAMPEISENSTIIINKENIEIELYNSIKKVYTGEYKKDDYIYKYNSIIEKYNINSYCETFEELINK